MKQHERQDTDEPIVSRIPTFRTIEEEAEFWDTHDLMDFEDEIEWVTDVKFVPADSASAITLVFDEASLAELNTRAQKLDTTPSNLARRWVLERLKESPSADASTQPAR